MPQRVEDEVARLWDLRTRLAVCAAELDGLEVDAQRWVGGRARTALLAEQARALRQVLADWAALALDHPTDAPEALTAAADALGRDDTGWPLRNRVHRIRVGEARGALDRMLAAVDACLLARGEVPDEAGAGRGRGERLTSNSRPSQASVRNAG